MVIHPKSETQQLPVAIPAVHIAGHALRSIAYSAGTIKLAQFGWGDFSHAFSETHVNLGQGLLHGGGDVMMLISSLSLAYASLKNAFAGAAETYYNVSGIGRRNNQPRRPTSRTLTYV